MSAQVLLSLWPLHELFKCCRETVQAAVCAPRGIIPSEAVDCLFKCLSQGFTPVGRHHLSPSQLQLADASPASAQDTLQGGLDESFESLSSISNNPEGLSERDLRSRRLHFSAPRGGQAKLQWLPAAQVQPSAHERASSPRISVAHGAGAGTRQQVKDELSLESIFAPEPGTPRCASGSSIPHPQPAVRSAVHVHRAATTARHRVLGRQRRL